MYVSCAHSPSALKKLFREQEKNQLKDATKGKKESNWSLNLTVLKENKAFMAYVKNTSNDANDVDMV